MDRKVGFEFRPTDVELLGYYLRSKLMGSTSFVDETINEIDMYSFDPWDLRFESKVKSRDPIWYFFCSSNQQTRKTSSGFWKITGHVTEIEDKWGIWCERGIIGFKKILRFHMGRTARRGNAEWVMHEYHLTILPENQRTHVICKVEYKGDDIGFLYDNSSESDNESTLFGDTSSSVDSVGDPNELISAPIPPLNSIKLQGKEKIKKKWGWKMAEEDYGSKITTVIKQIMEKKIYLKSMIKITVVLSIFSIIGWITLLP